MTVLLSVQGVSKAFGPRPLFTNLSLHLQAGERVGLIGANGSGKSTLLRLLAGRDEPDTGDRIARQSARIGYLMQDDTFPAGQSVRQVLLTALERDRLDDHEAETQAAIHLTQVGFADVDQPADQLSGGWRKRLALARELALRPDILLLDEPTNHLDLPGIAWLERLLRGSKFGYLVATHDRAFLRAVADEVVEIGRYYPEGYFRAPGNYDEFTDRRAEFLAGQAAQQERMANQVRVETAWLGRKAAARTRKAGSRIEDAAQRREDLAELKTRNSATGSAGIDFAGTGRKTRKLLTATGLSKSYGERRLFANVDVALTPGSKLGILGANGSGKSTLLKVLASTLTPDTGTVTRADALQTVLFEQGRASLDLNQTLRKALCPEGDTVMFRDRPMHVVAWAKQFLFQQEQLDVTLASLSGGEQARVRIAQMMLRPADLLLLDEPTNDLDIPALEVLEDSLSEYAGALVVISHDRDLLDRLCTEVIGLDGQGNAASYASVQQWLTAYARSLVEREEVKRPAAATVSKPAANPVVKAKKLSYAEQKELDGMETAIHTAEEQVTTCQAKVEQAATGGHIALTEACQALEAAQARVERLYARWQELEAKRGG